MTRQPNAIDFWRGFALVTIFINHIPGFFFEHFTHRNVSISDSAELFVFLAGWALRLSTSGSKGEVPTGQVLTRLGGRAITIYAAQLLITCLAIAMLAASAAVFEAPALLSWYNVSAIFQDPANAHLGLALLTYQLGYFDILPLYVVLMLFAPALVLIHRYAPSALLPLSFFVYLCALIFQVTPKAWPTQGTWFFNPLAWQFIFVLGFLLGGKTGLGGFARRHLEVLRMIGAPIVVIGAVITVFQWWPEPDAVPEPKLLFLAVKGYMTPMRLIQFLALAAVFASAYPHLERVVPALSHFLARLGRNSLSVFCVASLLSLSCQILRYVYVPTFMTDTAMLVCGLSALGFVAWVSEWRGGQTAAPARSSSHLSVGAN